jgi:hypothetical protein
MLRQEPGDTDQVASDANVSVIEKCVMVRAVAVPQMVRTTMSGINMVQHRRDKNGGSVSIVRPSNTMKCRENEMTRHRNSKVSRQRRKQS